MSEPYPPPYQPDEPSESGPGAGGSEPGPPYGQQPFPSYQPYQGGPQPPPGYGQPFQPYGHGYAQPHQGATTSMTLGITSLGVVLVGLLFLCGTISPLGAVIGPFAIWQAAKAKREIDAQPHVYSNRGHADTGMITGIIGTALGALSILLFVFVTIGIIASITSSP